MRKMLLAMITYLLLGPQMGWTQTPTASGSVVVTSEPGKAMMTQSVELAAIVAAIDKATRTVTLKGPNGTLDVVAGEEVRNFDQIRVGDSVVARYQRALSLELKKTRSALGESHVETTARAEPGAQPGAMAGRTITVLADVVAVDAEKSLISLKGPRGNVVDLQVQNPGHFKVVKVGDQVEAVYMEAVAIAVTRVPAASP
jgi:hypothetical protein